MGVNSVSSTTSTYDAYKTSKSTRTEEAASKTEKKSSSGVVYEKSSDIKKMSDSDRAALVKQLQTDQENRKSQLASLVTDMMSKQGKTFGMAQNEDSIWRFLAGGNFTVDAKTKADAQAAIADDGYWGVEQTSQRIFDFAYALAGDDSEKMKEMQAAVEKGFEQATKSWGKALPSISQETHSAIGDLFDSYYEKAGVSK